MNVNEKEMVETLLERVLGEAIDVEFLVADSQIDSQRIFSLMETLKIGHIIPCLGYLLSFLRLLY